MVCYCVKVLYILLAILSTDIPSPLLRYNILYLDPRVDLKSGGNLMIVWAEAFQGMAMGYDCSRFSKYDLPREV